MLDEEPKEPATELGWRVLLLAGLAIGCFGELQPK